MTWAAFEADAPELAESGRRLLERSGTGKGLLATVRGAASPRIHPMTVGIVEGRLLVFVIEGSAKERDLIDDGRYALHAHQDPAVPDEFLVRGRAELVRDPGVVAAAAAVWPFSVADGGYRLFELGIEHALLGERPDADTWPPRYRSWRATGGTG